MYPIKGPIVQQRPLKIKYENWIYDWMKDNKDLRLFFNIDHNTGIPKLMGYSRKRLNINEREEARVSGLVNLKDFTTVVFQTLQIFRSLV